MTTSLFYKALGLSGYEDQACWWKVRRISTSDVRTGFVSQMPQVRQSKCGSSRNLYSICCEAEFMAHRNKSATSI